MSKWWSRDPNSDPMSPECGASATALCCSHTLGHTHIPTVARKEPGHPGAGEMEAGRPERDGTLVQVNDARLD